MTSIPVAKEGELVGFILRSDLDGVPLEHKGEVTVEELMNPETLRVISKTNSVRDALRTMDRHSLSQLVVMDNDFVIGVVTREDIVEALMKFRVANGLPDGNLGDSDDDRPTSV